MSLPWYKTSSGHERYLNDAKVVKSDFPMLSLQIEDDTVSLRGAVSVYIGTKYEIVRTAQAIVSFPRDYPNREPVGRIAKGTFVAHPGRTMSDRHMGEDGFCCLNLPGCSEWRAEDSDGLRKWLSNFALFIQRQFIYDINGGVWVGPEWKHGSAGFAQFVMENLDRRYWPIFIDMVRGVPGLRHRPCPCGSGKRLASCHKQLVKSALASLVSHAKWPSKVANVIEAELSQESHDGDDAVVRLSA